MAHSDVLNRPRSRRTWIGADARRAHVHGQIGQRGRALLGDELGAFLDRLAEPLRRLDVFPTGIALNRRVDEAVGIVDTTGDEVGCRHGRGVEAEPAFHHIAMDLQTLGCADVWGIEQETNALALLQSMLRPRSFRQYLLTGMFLETSQRSGVTYLFRRLKPTVACAPDRKRGNDGMRVLACLCMHPIAYYAGSWAGAMCPTDDVVAHLSLMRADEHMFWKRCNQHPPYRPEAGL